MEKEYKRTSRFPSETTKQKISATMKAKNLKRSEETKQRISSKLREYWKNHTFPDDTRHEGTGKGYLESGDVV